MTSLNGSYMQSISPMPQVNYVALSPMPSTADEDEWDPIADMVISSIGILELDHFTLDMVSFQSVVLSSSEDLLEAMTDFFPLIWCPSRELFSWKP
jgi:hypothetical protein